MTYNILALDGGGVRGLFTAQVIKNIFSCFPEFISNVDLIAGTSTGGILALALATETDPTSLSDFYLQNLPKVFEDSYWDDVKDLGNLLGADYDYANLKKVLKKHFGDKKLDDLNKKVLIPTFDLDNEAEGLRTWKPKYFNNFQEDDLQELIVDVAIRTAAAPSFFPVYQGFADGGISANSPGMSAVAQALNEGINLPDINLLAIGTGYCPTFISGKKLDWGVSQWAKFLVPIFVDSMMFSTRYQCKKFLGDRYHRVDTALSKKIELDDTDNLNYLVESANGITLEATKDWLEKVWKK
jgi:patatin-like phospholipase/acyl hydrolase